MGSVSELRLGIGSNEATPTRWNAMPVAGWDCAAANLSRQRLWFKAVHLYNGLDAVVAMAIYLSYLERPNLAILVIRHVVSRCSPFLCSFGFCF
jgi:hypothetical protein